MRVIDYKDVKPNKYKIDEYGNVFSFEGEKTYPMSTRPDKDGYIKVGLMRKNGKQGQFSVHSIVITTYLGPPPVDMKEPTVNHKDENRANNYYTNLEWMEARKNISIRNAAKGEDCGKSKLTEAQVIEIKQLLTEGKLSQRAIGDLYGVTKGAIQSIHTGKTWKHIKL